MKTAIFVSWIAFWLYWLLAAIRAKPGSRRRGLPPGVRVIVVGIVVARVVSGNVAAVRDMAQEIVGLIVFACGIGLAVWARIYMGSNWGMPMTLKEEPELVTEGPYRFVRHPIYTGILLALLGTALATNLYVLFGFAIAAGYFVHSARVEERNLSSALPTTYARYRARTKMLIPFVL
jgi:protein-S-isoprenylcysteine O-methyltransferase Ste14